MKAALILLILSSCPIFARIGETPDQIAQRYGDPAATKIKDASETDRTYSSKGFLIAVYFLDGKSQGEIFQKQGAGSQEFSDTELQTILAADSFGQDWQPIDDPAPGKTEWTLATSPPLFAVYSKFDFPATLIIFTEGLHQKAAAEKAAGEEKNLSGF